MLLLTTPFDPAAAAPPRPSLRPFSWTALAAALGVGVGAAGEMGSALPPGLGHALALVGCRLRHALAGLAAGGFLGAHVLITASLTFGHRGHPSSVADYASALAYDVGANVLSAEWLFRGAIFSWCWRRASFWPAALVSTALALARYLLDPALPQAPEARAGAVFYLGLVGLVACALRAWSGSMLPGYLAGLAFFAAYRAVAP